MAIDAASRQLGRAFRLEFLDDLKALNQDKQQEIMDKVIDVASAAFGLCLAGMVFSNVTLWTTCLTTILSFITSLVLLTDPQKQKMVGHVLGTH